MMLGSALLMIMPTSVTAQFSGMIYYTFEQHDKSDLELTDMVIITDKNRMLIESSDSFSLMNGTQSSSILVRNDKEDFVIAMDAGRSLVLAKQDLDLFFQITQQVRNVRDNAATAGEGNAASNAMSGITFEETGNTDRIHGYTAKEVRVQLKKENDYMLFWYSEDLAGNWTMLHHIWDTFGREIFEDATPVNWIMEREIFPLKVELIRSGKVLYKAEATEISRSRKHLAKLEPEASVKLLNFQQFMMDLMMQGN